MAAPVSAAAAPMQVSAPVAVSQTPASKGPQYYKDIQGAQKDLKQVVKELRVNKVENALGALRSVLNALMKYSAQRYDVTAQA